MALYNFNENTGTTSADLSGNGRTATFGTGGTWAASGHTGSALSNTTADVGAKAVFNSPSDVITIMAWIKPLDLTTETTRCAFGFFDNGDSTGTAIFTQRSDYGTHNVLQGNIRIGANPLFALHGPALTVGVWTHVALTYDASTAILYKDGVAVDSLSATGNIGQGDALGMAGSIFDGSRNSQCVVDDVRIYRAALTAGQVVTGMNTPVI